MKRAIRRHHGARLKAERGSWWQKDDLSPRRLGKFIQTPTPCSCAGRCNVRRSIFYKGLRGLTRGERAFLCDPMEG